ncbi:MAG: hypothetical protein WEB37_03465 [Bacteroidota bacterium]
MTLSLQAQEPEVRASVDSTRYRIGEWIHVKVQAEMQTGAQMTGPAEGDSLGLFEVLGVKASEPVVEDNRKRQSFLVRLITFEPGETAIPPMEFRVISDVDSSMHQALTDSIPVSITTVEVEAEAELKDIKPPLAAPWAFEDMLPWLILLAIAAILAAAYWYYKKIKKGQLAQPEAASPPLPAHELALMALRQLEDKRLWQQGRVKDFYSEVTEIIRRFFEARFQIIALELTSDEILAQLKGIPSAQGALKMVNTFLLTADLVKFAKYEPSMAEHEEELQTAYSVVRALIPKPEPTSASVEAPADVR